MLREDKKVVDLLKVACLVFENGHWRSGEFWCSLKVMPVASVRVDVIVIVVEVIMVAFVVVVILIVIVVILRRRI